MPIKNLTFSLSSADPGKVRGCSLWFSHYFGKWVILFLPWLYGAAKPKPLNIALPFIKWTMFLRAKVWNGPGRDKVGIEFTDSWLDPNFLPSLAPTNHPSILVDISIFVYLKEIKKSYKQTSSMLVWTKFLCHCIGWTGILIQNSLVPHPGSSHSLHLPLETWGL